MANVLFMDPGTDATRDFSLWSEAVGTVSSTSVRFKTGTHSIACSTGSPATDSYFDITLAADAGRRGSFYYYYTTPPSADTIIAILQQGSGSYTVILTISLTTDGVLSVQGGSGNVRGLPLAANKWNRISFGYKITSSTVWRIDVYLNGCISSSLNSVGTLAATGTNMFVLQTAATAGANWQAWFDDIYFDDGSDYSDPGDIRITAKRPNANGSTNGFITQIGVGGSSYGAGHSPQVNERPLSMTNGWAVTGSGSVVSELYNIESMSVGDVNITDDTLVDYMGWVYAKSLSNQVGKITLNNISGSISLTSTATMFTKVAGSKIYPSGAGADIGIATSTAKTTFSLYECGVIFAFRENKRGFGGGVTYGYCQGY